MKALIVLTLVVTAQPTTYELRDSASHPVNTVKYATLKDCTDAAPIPAIKYRCIQTPVVFDKVGNCDDVLPPVPSTDTIVETRTDLDVDADGKRTGKETTISYTFTDTGGYVGHLCPDGLSFYFTRTQPVKAPYPVCWEVKPVQETVCT